MRKSSKTVMVVEARRLNQLSTFLLAVLMIACIVLPSAYARSSTKKTIDDEELCEHKNDCSGAPYALCKGGVCMHKQLFP